MSEDKEKQESKPSTFGTDQPSKPVAPKKGPEFFRNPEGGRLTTTKPPKESADDK